MPRNPYLNRSAIRTTGEFFGRRREVQHVMARIGAQTPQSVSLVGERRAGKSSLLWYLSQPEIYASHLEEPERYVFSTMDFQGQQHLDQEGFCRVFGQHLREAAGSRAEVPETGDLSSLEAGIQALDRAGLRLVYLFDEFETITRNEDFGTEFYGFLRFLANTYPVAFVTASRRNLENLCHNQEISESPFFNIFTQTRLGPMPEEEIRELIAAPSAAAGIPLEPHAEYIVSLGGHLPFFVQIACSVAFDHLAETGTRELDQEVVEQRFLEEAGSHFNYLWERFDLEEHQVIRELVEGAKPAPDREAVAKSLETDGYVQGEGAQPRLFSRAFVRFVKDQPADAPSRSSDSPGPKSTKLKDRLIRLGLVLAVLVLALLVYFISRTGPDDEAAPTVPLDLASQSLEINFHYQKMRENQVVKEGNVPAGSSSPSSHNEPILNSGDRFRLALTSSSDCFLYAYWIDSRGKIVHLADPLSSRPVFLQAGTEYAIPAAPDQWVQLDAHPGREEIRFLATRERDRELEEMYLRLGEVSPDRKNEYRRKLLARLDPQKQGQLDQERDRYRGIFTFRQE